MIWHYLAFETELKTTKTEKELEAVKGVALEVIQEIESARDFPTRETPLCNWCEYYDICPAKKHERQVENLPSSAVKEDTGVGLVDRYAALKEAQKATKEELESLEEAILDYADKNGLSVLVGTEKKVRITEKQVPGLPTKSSDPEGYAAVVDLLRKSGQWETVSTLDYRAAISELEAGQLPQSVAKELEQFVKTETKKKLFISRVRKEE